MNSSKAITFFSLNISLKKKFSNSVKKQNKIELTWNLDLSVTNNNLVKICFLPLNLRRRVHFPFQPLKTVINADGSRGYTKTNREKRILIIENLSTSTFGNM